MLYRIDVKLTGYEEIVVEAATFEEARDKAEAKFWEIYSVESAQSLRWKQTELVWLDNEELE